MHSPRHLLDPKTISQLGLPLEIVSTHLEVVRAHLKRGHSFYFELNSACVESNFGVIPLKSCHITEPNHRLISCHFIPAGGASSRYLGCLTNLWTFADHFETSKVEVEKILDELKPKLLKVSERLPKNIALLLSTSLHQLNTTVFFEALAESESPKALLPFSKGFTFLQTQLNFSNFLNRFSFIHFICPNGKIEVFQQAISHNQSQVVLSEQGNSLSTIRFDSQASPILLEGIPVVAPAGHGMLSKYLSKKSAQVFDRDFDYSFIQNIDNILNYDSHAVAELNDFLNLYESLLNIMREIRRALQISDFETANKHAEQFLGMLGLSGKTPSSSPVYFLIEKVLHCPTSTIHSKNILELFNKPFNILGQVPNTENNVGGLPLFIKQDGVVCKVCVEGPHISPEDSKFLKESKSAQFFNPVLVCAESSFDENYYLNNGKDLAIVAEKNFRGQKSYHCEYVLYELLGNSSLANVIFIGVSSNLFKPNKSILD